MKRKWILNPEFEKLKIPYGISLIGFINQTYQHKKEVKRQLNRKNRSLLTPTPSK